MAAGLLKITASGTTIEMRKSGGYRSRLRVKVQFVYFVLLRKIRPLPPRKIDIPDNECLE